MRRLIGLILLGGSLAVQAESPADPRRAMAAGEKALAESNLVEAAQQFALAADSAGAEKLDPAVPHHNRGIALLRDHQAGPASEAFQLASRTTDLAVQQSALFNRGNALLQLAGELETAGQPQPALQQVEEALALYEQAMMLRPQDPDPKVNYELATREKERLQELIQQQPPSSSQNQEQEQNEQQDKNETSQHQQPEQPPPPPDEQPPEQPSEQQPRPDSSPNQDEAKPDEAPASGTPQEMTREEATRLLDAMKEQEQANREQMARDRMRMNMGQLPPVEKDW